MGHVDCRTPGPLPLPSNTARHGTVQFAVFCIRATTRNEQSHRSSSGVTTIAVATAGVMTPVRRINSDIHMFAISQCASPWRAKEQS